jgi:hypothetical protein
VAEALEVRQAATKAVLKAEVKTVVQMAERAAQMASEEEHRWGTSTSGKLAAPACT